jgi:hypothetical protein
VVDNDRKQGAPHNVSPILPFHFLLLFPIMPRRPDSPYTDDTSMPCAGGFEGYGEVDWFAQNEGQRIDSVGLHFNDNGPGEE